MRQLYSIIIISVFTFVNTSCTNSSHSNHDGPDALEQLHSEVMTIHDEVMPRMQDIMKLKSEVKYIMDSLLVVGQDELESKIIELKALHNQLEEADQRMMNWMHEFHPVADSISIEAAEIYLKKEKAKIAEVKTIMLKAIEDASRVVTED